MTKPSQDEIEIATPEEQRAAINDALLEHLGENWRKDWILVHDANDLVRVHQGEINIDFQADLLANVEIIERPANPLQLSGRNIALMIIGTFLFLAFTIATLAGVFG
ncbi:MAG: hypothetical protein AAFV93_03525 [Chloroflexota bacterium]